ncbi:restriction endonuclease subunit S [Paenibacillus sp. LHD-117]|nr:restriction endonuclease subunit S [Paenibacillus sp. LHD-117]MDQ6420517.1 restriction endonuclease subunit S [Paenibacillus sp. LHD-117]
MKLGDLVGIVGGGTPSREKSEFWNGEIPWISVKDFNTTNITSSQETITEHGLKNSASRLIPKNNVIIPTRMALGKVAINQIDVAINQDLKRIVLN